MTEGAVDGSKVRKWKKHEDIKGIQVKSERKVQVET